MLDENLMAQLAARGTVGETFRRLTPDKKERIYRAAIRFFAEYGYDGLVIDDLCREAGISKGSFFQYFPSKRHLLEFAILVFDDYLERLVHELGENEPSGAARTRLRRIYHNLVVNSRLYPAEEEFYLFITRGLEHAAVSWEGPDPERHIRDYVTDVIRRGEATGEIRGDFDPGLTGQMCAQVLEALVRRSFAGKRLPRQQVESYLVSFLFDGIKA